jgi:hypothetical protein
MQGGTTSDHERAKATTVIDYLAAIRQGLWLAWNLPCNCNVFMLHRHWNVHTQLAATEPWMQVKKFTAKSACLFECTLQWQVP